ncbi:hypothetical protein, partial [Acetobacterium tundrae]
MAIIENQKVYYNTELEKLFKNHKIKGFFFKKFGWFKKKFEIEASAEYFEYDRIFEKFSVFPVAALIDAGQFLKRVLIVTAVSERDCGV